MSDDEARAEELRTQIRLLEVNYCLVMNRIKLKKRLEQAQKDLVELGRQYHLAGDIDEQMEIDYKRDLLQQDVIGLEHEINF